MSQARSGSFRLFRVAGIDVFLHWSWFVVAAYEMTQRSDDYPSLVWNAFEYLALFVLVLLHEFGHALACRSVGGKADHILLWPLGGVAYVQPPMRPGAHLWSIAAGPLVNLFMIPVLIGLGYLLKMTGLYETVPAARTLIRSVAVINMVLLVFNLLPVYPLDGGQILRSVLWFLFGRSTSLVVATVVGFAGVALLLLLAFKIQSVWIGVIAVFILLNCWASLRYALLLGRAAKAPRRPGFTCPACGLQPPTGAFWSCSQCRKAFDTFESGAACPHCGTAYAVTQCLECQAASPFEAWRIPAEAEPASPTAPHADAPPAAGATETLPPGP